MDSATRASRTFEHWSETSSAQGRGFTVNGSESFSTFIAKAPIERMRNFPSGPLHYAPLPTALNALRSAQKNGQWEGEMTKNKSGKHEANVPETRALDWAKIKYHSSADSALRHAKIDTLFFLGALLQPE